MKLVKSYFLNFRTINLRLLRLLFRNKNRPGVEILELNDLSKGTVSYMSIKLRVTNLIFLKIDHYVFPVYHDDVDLSLTVPLSKEQAQLKLYGIGAFKRTKSLKFFIADVQKINLKSGSYDYSGRFTGVTLKGNQIIIVPLSPEMYESNPVLSSECMNINSTDFGIELEQPNLKYDWHELNLELNKNL